MVLSGYSKEIIMQVMKHSLDFLELQTSLQMSLQKPNQVEIQNTEDGNLKGQLQAEKRRVAGKNS
jgi:hypothetical protein